MRRRVLAAGFMVVGSVLVGLLVGEAWLRFDDFSYYWSVAKRPDPIRGWSPVAGAVAWQPLEGKALVRINSAAMRDREHSLRKPPHTLRIAVLGDSFTEAVQVPVEDTYWALMEQRLSHCDSRGDRAVEVLNFGLSGYSTAQELLTLRHRVWAYDPDLVLLAFFTGNDFTENLRALDGYPMRPYFIFQGTRLALDDSFLRSEEYLWRDSWVGRLGFWFLTHSRLLQAIDRARDLHLVRSMEPPPAPQDGRPLEPGVDTRVYRAPRDPDWEMAWRVTEALLADMHEDVRKRGARFVVVTLTTGAQVHPDPWFRGFFQLGLGVDDLFYADDRIRAVGERVGFPVINLAPDMQEYATEHQAFLHGFANSTLGVGHWNASGHALAAQLISDGLCRRVLGQPPSLAVEGGDAPVGEVSGGGGVGPRSEQGVDKGSDR